MTDNKLYEGISKAAWGYFFVYFDFNINQISILPSFVGYVLFLSAISMLEDEEKELSLIRTMGAILVLWHLAKWSVGFIGYDISGAVQFVDIIVSLVNMYFHFQLLTNIAGISERYQPDGSSCGKEILCCRTVQTVLLTVVSGINALQVWLSEIWVFVSVGLTVAYIIIGVCLMRILFRLRKYIVHADD